MFNSVSSPSLKTAKLTLIHSKRRHGAKIYDVIQTKILPKKLNYTTSLEGKNIMAAARIALLDFRKEFGEIKSDVNLYNIIESIKYKTNRKFTEQNGARKTRKEILSKRCSSFEEYILSLKNYLKKYDSYIDNAEYTDLMLYNLQKRGIQAKNVLLYGIDEKGYRVSTKQHIFTLCGINKDTDISNPLSWGENSVICDSLLNKVMKISEGIEFYKKYFDFDPKKYKILFTAQ